MSGSANLNIDLKMPGLTIFNYYEYRKVLVGLKSLLACVLMNEITSRVTENLSFVTI